eukprot:1155460-Prymnesium_polylepis.1
MPGAEVHGRVYPSGRQQAFLRENFDHIYNSFGVDARSPGAQDLYMTCVPLHVPHQTAFAVFGECVWTEECARDFKRFYDHGGSGGDGKMFQWPGGDAVGVCPATGARVAPDGKTRHLLIACEMAGSVAKG